MRKIKPILLIAILALINKSCKEPELVSRQKNYDPVPYTEKNVILQKTDDVPKDYVLVGTVNIDKTNNYNLCSEGAINHFLNTELKKYGANVIHIQEYQAPQTKYECLKMKANLYRSFTNIEHQRFIPDTLSDKNNSYLYLYRPAYNIFQTVPFEILIDNKSVGLIKNNSTLIIPLNKAGLHEITAKVTNQSTIPILIEPGYSYYIKCNVGIGANMHNPCIQIVDKNKGSIEFAKISKQ